MKKLAIIILLAAASARADLINLTPTPFVAFAPQLEPKVYTDWIDNYYNTHLVHALPSDLYTVTETGNDVMISWDTTGTTQLLMWVDAYHYDNENKIVWATFWEVTPDSWKKGTGFITMGNIPVDGIDTFARSTPDTGTTLALFSFALLTLACARRHLCS